MPDYFYIQPVRMWVTQPRHGIGKSEREATRRVARPPSPVSHTDTLLVVRVLGSQESVYDSPVFVRSSPLALPHLTGRVSRLPLSVVRGLGGCSQRSTILPRLSCESTYHTLPALLFLPPDYITTRHIVSQDSLPCLPDRRGEERKRSQRRKKESFPDFFQSEIFLFVCLDVTYFTCVIRRKERGSFLLKRVLKKRRGL